MIQTTINQLRQYRHIKANILLFEQELDETILKSKAVSETGNKNAVSDSVAQAVLERDKIRQRIENLIQRKKAIESYLSSCDEYFGLLLRWHYGDGKTWAAIAVSLGGGNTEDGVRKACHRYVCNNP